MDIALRMDGDAVLVPIRARPRAKHSAILGIEPSGALKVALAAPPVDGAANEELLRFLGRSVLGIAPSSLSLLRGGSGRDKLVAVSSLSIDSVRERLLAAIER